MDLALEIVVFLKGYHLDNGYLKRWVIGVLDSTKGAL